MDEGPTTTVIQQYLDALSGDASAEPAVRELLERAAGPAPAAVRRVPTQELPRLTRPPVNLETDELLGEIGRGGMGVVYWANDLALDRDVAVKLLRDGYSADSPVAHRFTGEARVTAQHQHPGVPAVYRVGTLTDGRPFLAMKLIKGRTLAGLLRKRANTAVDRGRFVAVVEHVCQVVAYAHLDRVNHDKLNAAQRYDAVRFYSDAAMKLLRDAVSKGLKDVVQMKNDADLNSLRPRDNFQMLFAELEGTEK